MSGPEAQARRTLIDPALRLAGWPVEDLSRVDVELELALPDGAHQYVDYVLKSKQGKPLAVVEAKKTLVDARLGQEQALQYAETIKALRGGEIPYVFYTNGHDTWFWDSEHYPPRRVFGHARREDLEWFDFRRQNRRPLSVELIDTKIVERPYQIEAIRAVLERIEQRQRNFLVVMATGTGKTRTVAALIDVLTRASWAKRILFLVDRVALQGQALSAFKEHVPNSPRWPEDGETAWSADRRIYVTTYQTMLNKLNSDSNGISPFFFDLIICDEAHRTVYNLYKQILDYFDALKLGITATPKEHVDANTYGLFQCESGVPTFSYSFDEAVKNKPPFLCGFEVLNVRSKFQLAGIKGGQLPDEIQDQVRLQGIDPADIDFEGTDLERKVSNRDTNRLIVQEFMEESIKDQTGTLPGKSIFFCVSKRHARLVEEIFNEMYPEHRGRLARVIVGDDPRVHDKGGLLDQFKNNDLPRVALSVDMLDTGIDILELVNLVFAKPVYSYVKFWQMIGRGTRVLAKDPRLRKPWCTEKDKFLILDCWGNFEFFSEKANGREPGIQVPLPVRLFTERLLRLKAAEASGATALVLAVKDQLRADLAALPNRNVIVLENRKHLEKTQAADFWSNLGGGRMELLERTIAPILRARAVEEPRAMQLELDVARLSTARLEQNHEKAEVFAIRLAEAVQELPRTLAQVQRQQELVEHASDTAFWLTAPDAELDSAFTLLAPLMKYRTPNTQPLMLLDIKDLIERREWVEFGPGNERMAKGEYRRRVETFVQGLVEKNAILQRLHQGQKVGPTEAKELADVLASSDLHITLDTLRSAWDQHRAKFEQFLRHLVGVETLRPWEDQVSEAFSDFIAKNNAFTPRQLQFLSTLKTFMIQNGKVGRGDLVEAPFTNLHPDGVMGLFKPNEIAQILAFTEELTT
ncbi:MAG: type I restriction endonuclease subunit R [Thermoplasmatota archaeon]